MAPPNSNVSTVNTVPETLPVAAAEARAMAPLLLSDLETVARSRLFTVPTNALLVDVAARLSAHKSMWWSCATLQAKRWGPSQKLY